MLMMISNFTAHWHRLSVTRRLAYISLGCVSIVIRCSVCAEKAGVSNHRVGADVCVAVWCWSSLLSVPPSVSTCRGVTVHRPHAPNQISTAQPGLTNTGGAVVRRRLGALFSVQFVLRHSDGAAVSCLPYFL